MNLSSSYDSKKSDSTDSMNCTGGSASSSYDNAQFTLPPVPRRLCKSANNTSCSISCQSDSSASDGRIIKSKKKQMRRRRAGSCSTTKSLPPIGVFWDIENCQVPRNKSAASIVQRIREFFFEGYREADFIVACDVRKENPQVVQDLHDAQVSLIHVSSTSKNAADEKLRQSLRRFAETHSAPATVILISGDINFTADLSDLRYRKKIHVILVHNCNVADALILCANETYTYSCITDNLPSYKSNATEYVDLSISNLPVNCDVKNLKRRLKLLSDNCGGKVVEVGNTGTAMLRFSSIDYAMRAQRRLNGEDVYGNKITVSRIGPSPKPPMVQKSKSNCSSPSLKGIASSPKPIPKPAIQQLSAPVTQNLRLADNSFSTSAIQSYSQLSNVVVIRHMPAEYIGPPEYFSDQISMDFSLQLRLYNTKFSNILQLHHAISSPYHVVVNNIDKNLADVELILRHVASKRAQIFNMDYNAPTGKAVIQVLTENEAISLIVHLNKYKLGKTELHAGYLSSIDGRHCTFVDLQDLMEQMMQNNSGFCPAHIENGTHLSSYAFFMSIDNLCEFPNVKIRLKLFSSRLKTLLSLHWDCLSLLWFNKCYYDEFREYLPLDSTEGLNLEHLVQNVDNVCLKKMEVYFRNLKCPIPVVKTRLPFKIQDVIIHHPLANELKIKCVNLLLSMRRCQLSLSKFPTAFKNRYKHDWRIPSIGHSDLTIMLASAPFSNDILIYGHGRHKIVTLSKTVQLERFKSDLIVLLLKQADHHIAVSDFAKKYRELYLRDFSPLDFGMCYVEDLIDSIPDVVNYSKIGSRRVITLLSKKESPPKMSLEHFEYEMYTILSNEYHHEISFNKIAPTYHKKLGSQLVVSNYGFNKLVDLLRAIPDTATIIGSPSNDSKVMLNVKKSLDLLGNRLLNLLSKFNGAITIDSLLARYRVEYGYIFKLQTYKCKDISELVDNLKCIKLAHIDSSLCIVPEDKANEELISMRIWSLLLNPPHYTDVDVLMDQYIKKYKNVINLNTLQKLHNVTINTMTNTYSMAMLTPEYIIAAKLYILLHGEGGQIPLQEIETIFKNKYNVPMFVDIENIMEKFSHLVLVQNIQGQAIVKLNPDIAQFGLPLIIETSKLKPASDGADNEASSSSAVDCLDNLSSCSNPEVESKVLEPYNSSTCSKQDAGTNTVIPQIKPPHPSELPMPSEILMSGMKLEDSPIQEGDPIGPCTPGSSASTKPKIVLLSPEALM